PALGEGFGHEGTAHVGIGPGGTAQGGIEHAMPDDSTVHEAVFASAEVVKAKPKWSRQFKALLAMGIALVLIVGASFVGAAVLRPILGMDKVTDYPGPGSGQVVVTVQPGSGPRAVAQDMQQQGVIADVDTFLKAFASTNSSLHPGDFTFKKQMKASDAAAILAQDSGGKVIYFALSAGMRIGDSLDAIAKASGANRKDLDALNTQPGQFGLPANAKNLEGYLAPGEYKLPVGTSPKDILAKLVTTTTDELKKDGITDPAKQYEVLTIASIVQAEGGQADYGNVAGAVYNRLKPNDQTNGLIQSDATVTYGLGTKTVQLTDAQKQDGSNPYNTYVHTGLPPGPIGSPGTKAVAAAAHPTQNDYLFWVTVNLDTGETKFAKTYAEHQGYVAQYQQWCTSNAGKCQ
uniref:endolytic transglycosylase MltG n=1 Tax=Sinomonas sp. G460-2 TaxID=3393464 RepID=UPI0039EEF8A7